MACAKCNFYVPKPSTRAQALEASENLIRMLQEIPLLDEERAAVEDGLGAMAKLAQGLRDTATPDGRTPAEIAGSFGSMHRPHMMATPSADAVLTFHIIAVSGEITLQADHLYVQACQPATGCDTGVMFRRCDGRKDYTGGPNNFASLDLLNDPPALATQVRAVLAKNLPA
jgi:hypothetical protein